MKAYLLIVGLIVVVAVFGLFSFWPSLMEAHYGGSFSCPLISMGDASGCKNMNNHLNDLFDHISEFFSMISAILIGGIFSLFLLYATRLPAVKRLMENLFLTHNNKFKINRSLNFKGLLARSFQEIFLGLRKGIINTKVF